MTDLSHLTPEVQRAMLLPEAERIRYAQRDRWIGYAKADDALQKLADLLDHPRSLRMPNLLLVGESGNGKSTIVNRFVHDHPVIETSNGNPHVPVVLMQMPSEPSESRFWTELMIALKISHRDSDPVQRKKNQALSVLTLIACRMLIIDEIHNALYGHARQQRHFLGVLKNLSNDLKLPIVAVGIRDSIRTLHTDTQLSSRFEAFGLPVWELDREFLRLLASFERLLPLAYPSQLQSKELAIALHGLSGTTIGGLSRVLRLATVKAIRTGKERIDMSVLQKIDRVQLADSNRLESLKAEAR